MIFRTSLVIIKFLRTNKQMYVFYVFYARVNAVFRIQPKLLSAVNPLSGSCGTKVLCWIKALVILALLS